MVQCVAALTALVLTALLGGLTTLAPVAGLRGSAPVASGKPCTEAMSRACYEYLTTLDPTIADAKLVRTFVVYNIKQGPDRCGPDITPVDWWPADNSFIGVTCDREVDKCAVMDRGQIEILKNWIGFSPDPFQTYCSHGSPPDDPVGPGGVTDCGISLCGY